LGSEIKKNIVIFQGLVNFNFLIFLEIFFYRKKKMSYPNNNNNNNNPNPFLNNNPNRKVRSKAVNTVPLSYFQAYVNNMQNIVRNQQRRINRLQGMLGDMVYNNNDNVEDIYRLSMHNSYLRNQLYGYNVPSFFYYGIVFF
jgi:hypothetical protein